MTCDVLTLREKRQFEEDKDNVPILVGKAISKNFGGLLALKEVNFSIQKGSITSIIGPNGAGKTTLLNLITGFLPVSSGEIWFEGQRLNGLSPYHIASLGISRTFQDLLLFTNMSAVENIMVGLHVAGKAGLLDVALQWPKTRLEERRTLEESMRLLASFGLEERAFDMPQDLPYGQQKLLAVARALAGKPELLLLDEPAGGLTPAEAANLQELLLRVQSGGVTLLLVEHRMDLVMGISNHIIVLNYGRKLAEGTNTEVRNNPAVIAAYLGKEFTSEKLSSRETSATAHDSAKDRSKKGRSLEIRGLSTGYGSALVLRQLSLTVNQNEIVGLIGSNGAGKTTLLKSICGLVPVRGGSIFFGGQCIIGFAPNEVLKLGIAVVLEGRQLFASMTVMDNLLLGTYTRNRREKGKEIYDDLAYIFKLFPVLQERKSQVAGSLSGGEQQMLAIARGLMSKPKLILLDEPFLGLAPMIVQELTHLQKQLQSQGATILLAEQNARAALTVADRAYVMEGGAIVMEDRPDRLLTDDKLRKAYLGIDCA